MDLSLWAIQEYGVLNYGLCFVANIPGENWPLIDGKDHFEDELDLSPRWLRLEDFDGVNEDFKTWYKRSGFGYIFLEPGWTNILDQYKVNGCVSGYAVNGPLGRKNG